MKNIFLDLGSNRFQALFNVFKDKLKIDSSWAIYCYEANETVFNNAISDIKNPNHPRNVFSTYPDFNVYNIAVSDTTGIEEIKNVTQYTTKNDITYSGDAGASTLLKNVIWHQKNVVFETKPVKTLSIKDILNGIYLKYGELSNIYIKCDIEGYEYKVIRNIFEFKYTHLIKEIYIEWHPHFFEKEIDKKAEAYDLMFHMYTIGIKSFMHH